MYIKLTRMDGSPIWLNAAFVVTVEPRKGGGAIVVPIGDGLDYDVRETPEAVLSMLGEAPAAAIVPVPAPKMLAPTHEDLALGADEAVPAAAEEAAPAAETEAPAEVKPKRTRATTKKTTAAKPRSRAKKPALDFDEEQVARLKKMAPGSVRKLVNTLTSQFKVEDAESTVKALEANGVIVLDQDHVAWQ